MKSKAGDHRLLPDQKCWSCMQGEQMIFRESIRVREQMLSRDSVKDPGIIKSALASIQATMYQ